jgi:hypothetical protein
MGLPKFQLEPHSAENAGAQVRLGGVVSTTVMVWLQLELLVQGSVAVHVRVALKVLPQKPVRLVVVVALTVTLLPLQRSLMVGVVKAHVVPHSTT